MNARKAMKSKKAAKAVAPKKETPASKGSKRSAATAFDGEEERTSKRAKPPKAAPAPKAKTSSGKAKAPAPAPARNVKAAKSATSPGKKKAAPKAAAPKAKVAPTSAGKTKAAATSAGKAKAAAKQPEPKQARGRGKAGKAARTERAEPDAFTVEIDEVEIELDEVAAAAGTIEEDDDALDDAEDDAEARAREDRPDPLVSDITEIRGPRDENDEDALREAAALELGEDLSADSQPAPTTRAHLKRVVESLIFVADQPVSANQLGRLVKAKQAEVRDVVTEIMRDYDGRGIELVEVAGGFAFRSAAASAPFVRDLVSARPVRLTRAQLETLALIAYRQPITRPEIDDVRGVDSGSAIKVLLDRDLVKILGRKDEAGRPLLYGTAPQFLDFFGMKSLSDLPTLREFTELSEENRELFAKKMGEVPDDLSDPSLTPQVHTLEYDEEGNPIVREPEAPVDETEATTNDGELEPGAEGDEGHDGEPQNAVDEDSDERDSDDAARGEDADDELEDVESDEDESDEAVAEDESDDDEDDDGDEDSDDKDEADEDERDDEEDDDSDDEAVAEDDSDEVAESDEDDEEEVDDDSDEDDEEEVDEDEVSDDEVTDEHESDEDESDDDESDDDEDDEDVDDDDDDGDEDEGDDEDMVAQDESEADDVDDEDAPDDEEGDDEQSDDDDDDGHADEEDDDEDSGPKPS